MTIFSKNCHLKGSLLILWKIRRSHIMASRPRARQTDFFNDLDKVTVAHFVGMRLDLRVFKSLDRRERCKR